MWVELESSSVNFLKSLLNFSFMNICSKKHSLHILEKISVAIKSIDILWYLK